jgi:hypothetical protein
MLIADRGYFTLRHLLILCTSSFRLTLAPIDNHTIKVGDSACFQIY